MGPWSDPGNRFCMCLRGHTPGGAIRDPMSVQTIQSTAPGQSRDRLLGTPAADHALGALALAAGYFATAQIGEALAFPNAPVSALWLPNALIMGTLLLT